MHRRTFLLTAIATLGVCQEPEQPPSDQGQYEFVSGTIAELPPGRIVVNRTVLGKSENRTFLLTTETTVEGTLRVNARVTVRYKSGDNGDPVALRVIVRPAQRLTQG